ncbi:hypothetical protein GGI25_003160, partial [Coemansia spiralis]
MTKCESHQYEDGMACRPSSLGVFRNTTGSPDVLGTAAEQIDSHRMWIVRYLQILGSTKEIAVKLIDLVS